MNGSNTCSRCGKPFANPNPMGLCPDCLLAVGLGSLADATAPGAPARFTPPDIEALAPLFPQLEIEAPLGCGGMGAVYRARQRNLDRTVALKILPPDIGRDPAFAERFAREAKALARLNHPNIVTLYEFGRAGDLFYFLMEYVDGVNLRQIIRNERIAPREALAIVPQICDALQYAHDQGIVHRDIKPENILLDRRGRVKVADFGVAKLVRAAEPTPQAGAAEASADGVSHASLVMGTPSYMAPEQRERPSEVDHRADIYSLGVVLYQMLTGELPAGNVVPPSKKIALDVRIDEIVLRALEKTPERRYQHVSDIKTMCETLSQPAVPGRPPPTSDNGKAESERARRFCGDTAKSAPDWRAPDSGWGWLVGRVFGITFTSQTAWTCANLSVLGFLGALGFLGYQPGMRWCFGLFGFSGFFGLIGVAYLIELGSPLRRHSPLTLVERRGDCAAIRWPDTVAVFIGLFTLSALAFSIFSMATRGTFDALGTAVTGTAFAASFLWVRIRDRKKALLAQPPPEISVRVPAVYRWGEIPWIPYSVFLVLYLAFLVLQVSSDDLLPPRVATHFGFSGQADGWMDRGSYLAFEGISLAALAAFFAGISLFVRSLPARYINLPRKDYWLTPARRALTGRILRARMGWLLCLMTLFFAGLHVLTLQANRVSPPQLPMGGLLMLIIAFLLGVMIWVSLLLMRFAEADVPVQHDGPTAAERRRARWSLGLLFAVTAVIALRMWVVGVYAVQTDSASPEMPKGSVVLTWKPARALSPGDLVVYRKEGRFWVGRVSDVQNGAVRIARNREPETLIPKQALRGRVISVLWRGTPEKKVTP